MKSLALVGTSGYGEVYLGVARRLEADGLARITAATIVDRAREQKNWDLLSAAGVDCFESTISMWEAMEGRIDLCLLPTAPHTHVPLAIEALRHGAHVLVEKPLCPTLEGVAQIRAAIAETGRQLFVGYQDLYVAENHRLKRQLLRGDFGQIKRITFCGLWPRPESYYTRNQWSGRRYLRGNPIFDSPASNAFAHFLNLALFWAGASEDESALPVSVDAELLRAKPIETFDTCALRIATSTDIPILFLTTHSCPISRVPALVLETDAGPIRWFHEDKITLPPGGDSPNSVIRHLPGTFGTRNILFRQILNRLAGLPAKICNLRIAEAPIHVTECLFHHPVIDLPEADVTILDEKTDPLHCIDGIEEIFAACLAQHALPSELKTRSQKFSLEST